MVEIKWILSIFSSDCDLIFIFAESSPFSILLILLGTLFMAVSVVFIVLSIKKRIEKRALMTDRILPEIGAKFGENVSVSEFETGLTGASVELRFDRRQTNFAAKIIRTIGGRHTSSQTGYTAEFKLPDFRSQFYIEPKSSPPNDSTAWRPLPIPEMQKDAVFYSLSPDFLPSLLAKENVRAEVSQYGGEFSPQFKIAFENGEFVISQLWSSEDDWQDEAQRIEQVCRTAVVFHDELINSR